MVDLGPGRLVAIFPPADGDALLEAAAAREARGEPDEGAPYWAVLWASAAPLARWLLASDLLRPGARVLELGCGLGLVGIALAKFASAEVVLTDGLEGALDRARTAVEKNGPFARSVTVAHLDWRSPEASLGAPFDLVVAADCLYNRSSFGPLARCARRWLAPAGRLVLAEPGRAVARDVGAALAAEGFEEEGRFEAERGVLVSVYRTAKP
jgi:predicted nicotinamide N-methyase